MNLFNYFTCYVCVIFVLHLNLFSVDARKTKDAPNPHKLDESSPELSRDLKIHKFSVNPEQLEEVKVKIDPDIPLVLDTSITKEDPLVTEDEESDDAKERNGRRLRGNGRRRAKSYKSYYYTYSCGRCYCYN